MTTRDGRRMVPMALAIGEGGEQVALAGAVIGGLWPPRRRLCCAARFRHHAGWTAGRCALIR